MPGPLPQATRRRRNAPTIPTTTLPAEGREGPAPRVPRHVKLGPAGRAWWRWAWSTPSASQWDETADLMTVARRAQLEDRLVDPEAPASLHAQATNLEDRLGLTPKARAQLRWRIEGEARAEAVTVEDNVVTPGRWQARAGA